MPQLSPLEPDLMAVDQARQLSVSSVVPINGYQSIALSPSLVGRIPTKAYRAQRDVPGFTNSAVDGYAVTYRDYCAGQALRVIGTQAAGETAPRALTPHSCVRVMTGARIPDNADLVVMFEDSRIEDQRVYLRTGLPIHSNIRPADDVIAERTVICEPHQPLSSGQLGLLYAASAQRIRVFRRCRIALLATGNELAQGSVDPHLGQIVDTNTLMLQSALVERRFCCPQAFLVADNQQKLTETLTHLATNFDLVITTGGIATGDKDLVLPAIAQLGVIHFSKVAIKPGRPVSLATVADTPILCLPGNPIAALLGLYLFGLPALRRRSGWAPERAAQWPPRQAVTAGFDHSKKAGRTEFICSAIQTDAAPIAIRVGSAGAGVLSAMIKATGFVMLAAESTRVSLGDNVDYIEHCAW